MFMDQWNDDKAIDVSSDDEPYDSDQITSDVEAELYSVIHHETDTSTINFEDSYRSVNTSDKENNSIISYSLKINDSNSTIEKSNNSSNGPIIITPDKCFADDKAMNCNLYKSIKNSDKNVINSFNESLKRKSNSNCINFEDTQPNCKKIKNNKQNISKHNNTQVNSKLNETVVVSSSDEDDNDIICIEPSDKNKHFETNLSETRVEDSDSADSWCFKSTIESASTPRNCKTKDLWSINNEDLYRLRRSLNRYHDPERETCNLCKQKGHSSKFCSSSKGFKCFICGEDHSAYRCRNRICAKCFGYGHDIKNCAKAIAFCEMCQMSGHYKEFCPDLWRRFQRTTPKRMKKIWRLIQDTPFFCYNCGLPGHFGALCKGRRMNIPMFPTWPFALDYNVNNNQPSVKTKVKPVIISSNEEFCAENQQQGPLPKKKKKRLKKNVPDVDSNQQISFPRTPKDNQMTTDNETIRYDSRLINKLNRKQSRNAKRLRRKQKRKEMLLQREALTKE